MSTEAAAHSYGVACAPKKNPGAWDSTIVSIFDSGRQIGSYERGHPGWGDTTFFPFERDGRWYALYSADYTRTSLMTLPDCREIGGEPIVDPGFCPVEFYVPRQRRLTNRTSGHVRYEFDNEEDRPGRVHPKDSSVAAGEWAYLDIGFVAGCVWGDDSSWKLQIFDLRRAAEGVLERDARFGHVELARGKSLRDSVDFGHWKPESPLITVVRQEVRNLVTGELTDPYDL